MADPDGIDRLEDRLVDLGRRLELASPPDLRASVLARLAEPAPSRTAIARVRHRPRRRFTTAAAAALAALVLVGAVTPAGQAAVARVVHVFGVVLRLGAPDAPRRPERLPQETVTPLDAARRQVTFPVVVPPSLGRPDEVSVSDAGRVVSLVYRAAPGRPTPGAGGVSARLDEFDGTLEPGFLKQLSAQAQWSELPDGSSAVWLAGPHDVEYVDRAGVAHPQSAHLAGHTLIWSVGVVTLRLEGDFTFDQAVAIAAATTPSPAPGTS